MDPECIFLVSLSSSAGVLAALWKLGVLDRIGTTWTVIGVVIALGIGIMASVSSSGTKENIESTGSEKRVTRRQARTSIVLAALLRHRIFFMPVLSMVV